MAFRNKDPRPPAQPVSIEEMQRMAAQAQAQSQNVSQWGGMISTAYDMQAAAMAQQAAIADATAGSEVGSMTWARQVMSVIAPPEPGFVKRCSCKNCGAPKKLPSVTAYVYCDYCGSLMDYDLRRACDSDTATPPAYAQLVNGMQANLKAAQAAGDRDGYRGMQKQIYDAYVTYVPNAVSHRARNDAAYRQQLVDYLAESAVVQGFEPELVALTDEMRQRCMGLQYTGSMMAQKVQPESFWPLLETLSKQIEASYRLNRANGVTDLDPDHAEHMAGKMACSLFCQGWLTLLPEDAAGQLLEWAGLTNQYVPIEAADGSPRSCGGCGGKLTALPGATQLVCDGCGRTLDVGSAEIPCVKCGATMTFPVGATATDCPYCHTRVEKVGII
jgi:hypothetical protein